MSQFDGRSLAGGSIHRVAWTRGHGCAEIADRLAGGTATKVDGDLRQSCIRNRIDTLVTRRLSGFDLVPMVVPHDVEIERVDHVTAAVAAGPHSPFAAAVAARLGLVMGIDVAAVTVRRPDADADDVATLLSDLAAPHARMETLMVEGESVLDLIETLPDTSLLVVGAPGGSWLQRQIFGTGHRLQVAAPVGTLTVRSAPQRCFHLVGERRDAVVGSEMAVADARHVVRHAVVSVADHGLLVGLLRRKALVEAPDAALLSDIMEPPVAVDAADEVSAIRDVRAVFEGGPIPVVDGSDRLVGLIPDEHAA